MFYTKREDDKSREAAIRRRREIVMREDESEDDVKQKPTVQTKLEINSSDDQFEQQADEVAKKVSNNEDASQIVKNQPTLNSTVQNKNEESGTLMKKGDDGNLTGIEKLQTSLDSSKGGGQNLDDSTKTHMEKNMGVDLSDVKIHTDSQAHEMAKGINAQAFTDQNHIYFNQGKYNPGTTEGNDLLGHELTHVQQQKGGGVQRKIQRQPPKVRKLWTPPPPQEAPKNDALKVVKTINVNGVIAGSEEDVFNQETAAQSENFSDELNNLVKENPKEKKAPVSAEDARLQTLDSLLDTTNTIDYAINNLNELGSSGWNILLRAAFNKASDVQFKIRTKFSEWLKKPASTFSNYLVFLSSDLTTVLSDYAIAILDANKRGSFVDKKAYVSTIEAKMDVASEMFRQLLPTNDKNNEYSGLMTKFELRVAESKSDLEAYAKDQPERVTTIGANASDIIIYLRSAQQLKDQMLQSYKNSNADFSLWLHDPKAPSVTANPDYKEPEKTSAFPYFANTAQQQTSTTEPDPYQAENTKELTDLYTNASYLSYGFSPFTYRSYAYQGISGTTDYGASYKLGKEGLEDQNKNLKKNIDLSMVDELAFQSAGIIQNIKSLNNILGSGLPYGDIVIARLHDYEIKYSALIQSSGTLKQVAQTNTAAFYKFYQNRMEELPAVQSDIYCAGVAATIYQAWSTYDKSWALFLNSPFLGAVTGNPFASLINTPIEMQKDLLSNCFVTCAVTMLDLSLKPVDKIKEIAKLTEDQKFRDMMNLAKKFGKLEEKFEMVVKIVIAVAVLVVSMVVANAFGTYITASVLAAMGVTAAEASANALLIANTIGFFAEVVAFTTLQRTLSTVAPGGQAPESSFGADLFWNAVTFGVLKGLGSGFAEWEAGLKGFSKYATKGVAVVIETNAITMIDLIRHNIEQGEVPPDKRQEFNYLSHFIQGLGMIVALKMGMSLVIKLPPKNNKLETDPELVNQLGIKEAELDNIKKALTERDLVEREKQRLTDLSVEIMELRIKMADKALADDVKAKEDKKLSKTDKDTITGYRDILQSKIAEVKNAKDNGVHNLREAPGAPDLFYFEGEAGALKSNLLAKDPKGTFENSGNPNTFTFADSAGNKKTYIQTRSAAEKNLDLNKISADLGFKVSDVRAKFWESAGERNIGGDAKTKDYIVSEALTEGWRPDNPEVAIEKGRRFVKTEHHRIIDDKFGGDTDKLSALNDLENMPYEQLKIFLDKVPDANSMDRFTIAGGKPALTKDVSFDPDYIRITDADGNVVDRIDGALGLTPEISSKFVESKNFELAKDFGRTLELIPDASLKTKLQTRLQTETGANFEKSVENTNTVLDRLSPEDKTKMGDVLSNTKTTADIQHYANVKTQLPIENPTATEIIETANQTKLKDITGRMLKTSGADFTSETMSDNMRSQFGADTDPMLLEQAYEGLHKSQLAGRLPGAEDKIFIGNKFYFSAELNPAFFGDGGSADVKTNTARIEQLNAQNPNGLNFTADGYLNLEPLGLKQSNGKIVLDGGSGDPVAVDLSKGSDMNLDEIKGLSTAKKARWGKSGEQRTYNKDASNANKMMRQLAKNEKWPEKWKQPKGTKWWNVPGTDKMILLKESDLKMFDYKTGVHDKGMKNVTDVDASKTDPNAPSSKRMMEMADFSKDFEQGKTSSPESDANFTTKAVDHPQYKVTRQQIYDDVQKIADKAAATEYAPGKKYKVDISKFDVTNSPDRAQFVVKEVIDQKTGDRSIEIELYAPLEGEFYIFAHEGRHVNFDLKLLEGGTDFTRIINDVDFITPEGKQVNISDKSFEGNVEVENMVKNRFNPVVDAITEYHNRLYDYKNAKESINKNKQGQPLSDADKLLLGRLAADVKAYKHNYERFLQGTETGAQMLEYKQTYKTIDAEIPTLETDVLKLGLENDASTPESIKRLIQKNYSMEQDYKNFFTKPGGKEMKGSGGSKTGERDPYKQTLDDGSVIYFKGGRKFKKTGTKYEEWDWQTMDWVSSNESAFNEAIPEKGENLKEKKEIPLKDRILPKNLVVLKTKGGFTAYDSEIDLETPIAAADFDKNGFVVFGIYTDEVPTNISGGDAMLGLTRQIDASGIKYNGFRGIWGISSNTKTFNKLLEKGYSKEAAAWNTFTGIMAQKYGYDKLTIDKLVPEQGPPYTTVNVTFSKK